MQHIDYLLNEIPVNIAVVLLLVWQESHNKLLGIFLKPKIRNYHPIHD